MIRVYHSQSFNDKEITLNKEQIHYITKVMRLSIGERFRIFNEQSGDWIAEIIQIKRQFSLKLITQINNVHKCSPLHLFFAPIKHDGMTFIIQKGTELGVTEFHPIITEHSNTRRINLERLQKNAIEASEQCERLNIPKVHDLIKLTDLTIDNIDLYICLERHNTIKLGEIKFTNKAAGFLVGPEGGLSEKDLFLLNKVGKFKTISLGPLILRAETACITAIAYYQMINNSTTTD